MNTQVAVVGEAVAWSQLPQNEQVRAVRGLRDSDPVGRLPLLGQALDLEPTRARTLAVSMVAEAVAEVPDEALPLIEKGLNDPNDRVSAASVRALSGLARTAPERVVPLLDYAMTRRRDVRSDIGDIALQFFEIDPGMSLEWLNKALDDEPNAYQAARNVMQVVQEQPELFDLDDTSLVDDETATPNEWRQLLEKALKQHEYNAQDALAVLEEKKPGSGINLLVLASKIQDVSDRNRHRDYYHSLVSSCFTSWGIENDAKQVYYDRIQANPEAKAYLDRDIESLTDAEYGAGYEWKRLVESGAVPELSVRIKGLFPGRTRRISDTSAEYAEERAKIRAREAAPQIFGYGAVEAPGVVVPEDQYHPELSTIKYYVEHLDEDVLPGHTSEATRRKVRYLKSLFENDDPEEINNERLANFLKVHIDEHMALYRESMARLPEWEERFLERLPATADRELAIRRLHETRVTFFDELSRLTGWEREDASGTFDDRSSLVRVDLMINPVHQEKVYTHEMFHALSGRALVHHPRSLTDREKIVNQKTGLRFTAGKEQGRERFRWLNEAVTEDLTQAAMPHGDYGTYRRERDLLSALCTSGKFDIDHTVFERAYFENFNAGAPSGGRVPHWQALQEQLREAYGGPILVEVDDIVRQYNLVEAIGMVRSYRRHLPPRRLGRMAVRQRQ